MRKSRSKYQEKSYLYDLVEKLKTDWSSIALVFSIGFLSVLLGAIVTRVTSIIVWLLLALIFSGIIVGLFILVGLKKVLMSWQQQWNYEKAQKTINDLQFLASEIESNIKVEDKRYLEISNWNDIRKETEIFPIELYSELTDAYLHISAIKECSEEFSPVTLKEHIYNDLNLVELLGRVNNLKEKYKRTYFKA